MYQLNDLAQHRQPQDPRDAESLGRAGADRVQKVLSLRVNSAPTPLQALPGLARELGLAAIHMKDEGYGLGLGSFKALSGAYSLMMLVWRLQSKKSPFGAALPAARLLR